MKWLPIIAVLPLFLSWPTWAQATPELTDKAKRINYAFGVDIVQTFQQQEFTVDQAAFLAGMQDSLADKARLTPEQKEVAFKQLFTQLQAKAEARSKLVAASNLVAGTKFLAANASKEDIHILKANTIADKPAALQYKVLKTGAGPSPKITDVVEVHFTGWRIDGSEFDSSVRRGTPATFGMKDVIPGWRAALQQMRVGDKWQLFIPAELAYGEYGLPQLEPNSTLVFELELLSFYTPKPAATTPTAAGH